LWSLNRHETSAWQKTLAGLHNLKPPVMKHLAVTLLTFLVITGINANAQKSNATRSETELWLLEKMNKYVFPKFGFCDRIFPDKPEIHVDCYEYTDVNFKFTADNLVINLKVNKTDLNNIKSSFSRTITIPLYALNGDSTYMTEYKLYFFAKYAAIKFEDSNGKTENETVCQFGFKTNGEENFISRFNNGINHLRTFIKKPKSNEAF
jgi:hypothetical protein